MTKMNLANIQLAISRLAQLNTLKFRRYITFGVISFQFFLVVLKTTVCE